jgi:hypothetical protein
MRTKCRALIAKSSMNSLNPHRMMNQKVNLKRVVLDKWAPCIGRYTIWIYIYKFLQYLQNCHLVSRGKDAYTSNKNVFIHK